MTAHNLPLPATVSHGLCFSWFTLSHYILFTVHLQLTLPKAPSLCVFGQSATRKRLYECILKTYTYHFPTTFQWSNITHAWAGLDSLFSLDNFTSSLLISSDSYSFISAVNVGKKTQVLAVLKSLDRHNLLFWIKFHSIYYNLIRI